MAEGPANCSIPLYRKRKAPDHLASPYTAAKHLELSPSPAPDSTLSPNQPVENYVDPIEELKSLEEDMSNFRRFSGRSKKQTNFFCPIAPASFHRRRSNSATNAAVRALKFPSLTSPVDSGGPAGIAASEEKKESIDNGEGEDKVVAAMETATGEEVEINKPQKPQQQTVPQEIKKLPIGSLIWGKLPGYEWWPGCIISFDKKKLIEVVKDEDDDDEDTEEDEEEKEEDGGESVWVKWYGDNQLSQISFKKIFPFGSNFLEFFSPNKLRGLYKKAVVNSLKEAARRCSKDIGCTLDERKPSWIFHSSQFQVFLDERKALNNLTQEQAIEATPEKIEQGEKSPVYSPDSSFPNLQQEESSIFTQIESDQESDSSPANGVKEKGGGRGAKKTKTGQFLLSLMEKDLLQWALTGFLPTGPDGFRPRPEHLIDIKMFPFGESPAPGNQFIIKRNEMPMERGRAVIDHDYDKKPENKLVLLQQRNKAQFELIKLGQLAIENICIACGSVNISAQHPLFYGGLCKHCKETFMECAYMFDEDGSQMYCTICSGGSQVFMCDTPNCSKVYCNPCIEKLCGPEERMKVQDATEWQCYMCSGEMNGLLRKREDWDKRLHDLFVTDIETEFEPPKFFPPIPADMRKPMRVLGLFDGIGTGLLVLKELGINVEVYIASEIDPDAIKVSRIKHPEIIHVGAIEQVTEKEVAIYHVTVT